MAGKSRLPAYVGDAVKEPLLYNPYQQAFLSALRQRYCRICRHISAAKPDGTFTCAQCGLRHTEPHTWARVYRRLSLIAGRRSGKSLIGAHAAREEAMVPNTVGWVIGPTFKVLHDATMPTFLRLIPRDWIADWSAEHEELRLVNGSLIAFRSLDDPERGRGMGTHWAWFDEACYMAERAWDVFRPSLTEHRGVAWFTSSPAGYDWVYNRLWKPATVEPKPGFWACQYETIDNPFIKKNAPDEIEEARQTMTREMFDQEYRGKFVNFTGAIYDAERVERQTLRNDDAIRQFIPEWPEINPDRTQLVGLDSGSDHPFGMVLIVVTERGLICVREYLERKKSFGEHIYKIRQMTGTPSGLRWAANRNESQLRIEFAQYGIGIIGAENNQIAGIQRVQAWMNVGQLWFAYTCPKTIEQFKAYRYAENLLTDGQKRDKELVFKLNDELPDAVRYAVMTWPTLPKAMQESLSPQMQARWDHLDPKARYDLDKMKEFNKRTSKQDLTPVQDGYPSGDFWQNHEGNLY